MKHLRHSLLALLLSLTGILAFYGCSDSIDESNLYVSTGSTLEKLLSDNPDFSIYHYLLTRVKLSPRTKSTVA